MPTRIPAAQVSATRWALPNITDGAIIETERVERDAPDEPAPPTSEHVPAAAIERGTLTAMELEEIAQSAHSEGYLAGKTEGYEAGIAAGRQDGERIGREHGRAQAYDETRAELQLQIQHLRSIIDHLMLPVVEQQAGLESAIQRAVVAMVENIVGRELSTDSSHVADLVGKVVDALPFGARNIRLRMHTSDMPHIESIRQQHPEWDIQADDSVGKGGCRVATDHSLVDFTVDARIKAVLEQWHFEPADTTEVMEEIAETLTIAEADDA